MVTASPRSNPEELADFAQDLEEAVHLGRGVVEVKAGPGGRGHGA